MQIRRFEADDIQGALKQIKSVLGPEALILSTRTIRAAHGSRRSRLEIVAAVDQDPVSETRPPRLINDRRVRAYTRPAPPVPPATRDKRLILERLLAAGLSPNWVQPLLQELQADGDPDPHFPGEQFQDRLFKKLTEGVEVIEPGMTGKRAWALVGPTGVGKTTTLAKLAAHFSLKRAKKVRLITIDTYRIGAVDQLKTYARILGLPFKVAAQPEELKTLVEGLSEEELALIDTTGSSPNNPRRLQELQDFLTGSSEIGSHLVLSATAKEVDLARIIDRFSCLPVESYVCTKLDETEALLPLFNQLVPRRRPLSYLTGGQRVPEDLEPATKSRIAQLIIKQIHWN